MDKATGLPVIGSNGQEITSEVKHTPITSTDSVALSFTFNAADLKGTTIVAFEQVSDEYGVVAKHEDLTDEDQIVRIPELHTFAADANGSKSLIASGRIEILDTVEYSDLKIGDVYTVKGILMNKATGEAYVDGTGNQITAEKTFTATASEGSIVLRFVVENASNVGGGSIVAFEDLYYENVLVGKHEDLNDEDQTVSFPEIRTSAHDRNNDKEFLAADNMEIIDTVTYSNLTPGESYTVRGELRNKATGKLAKDANGDSITAETSFTPVESSGTVDLTFEFDGSNLKNTTLVAFEDLYSTASLIARHADLEDQDQTVTIPEIRTTLQDKEESHVSMASKELVLTDTVLFHNLIPGREYTVEGVLYNKETGEPVMEEKPFDRGEFQLTEFTATVMTEFEVDVNWRDRNTDRLRRSAWRSRPKRASSTISTAGPGPSPRSFLPPQVMSTGWRSWKTRWLPPGKMRPLTASGTAPFLRGMSWKSLERSKSVRIT